jgi:hypothetical protein
MTGYRIVEVTGSQALASGYFVNAVRSLRKIGGQGVCRMLRRRMPNYVSSHVESDPSPIHMFKSGPISPPQLLRSNASDSATHTSSDDASLEDDTTKMENLETVTYVQHKVTS